MCSSDLLYERQLEEYYCTLLYSVFDFKHRTVTLANAGLPYPVRKRADGLPAMQIEMPGVPLGSFYGTTYDEIVLPLGHDEVFVFCSDGVSEAMNRKGEEFTSARAVKVVEASRTLPASEIVPSQSVLPPEKVLPMRDNVRLLVPFLTKARMPLPAPLLSARMPA